MWFYHVFSCKPSPSKMRSLRWAYFDRNSCPSVTTRVLRYLTYVRPSSARLSSSRHGPSSVSDTIGNCYPRARQRAQNLGTATLPSAVWCLVVREVASLTNAPLVAGVGRCLRSSTSCEITSAGRRSTAGQLIRKRESSIRDSQGIRLLSLPSPSTPSQHPKGSVPLALLLLPLRRLPLPLLLQSSQLPVLLPPRPLSLPLLLQPRQLPALLQQRQLSALLQPQLPTHRGDPDVMCFVTRLATGRLTTKPMMLPRRSCASDAATFELS